MLLGANIMNNGKDNLEKFDSKFDGVIFLGYSTTSKEFWVFNKWTLIVEKSVHVVFDEFNDLPLKDVSRNAGIEENMESLEITQDDKKTQEEANEKVGSSSTSTIGSITRWWKFKSFKGIEICSQPSNKSHHWRSIKRDNY